jgi:DNA-binding MarR family transcriptional regulator
MNASLIERQHAVKEANALTRTPAGEALTELVVLVARLGGEFTEIGEELAALGDQTLARWVVLDAVHAGPASVAQVARRLRMARQSVQRVADLLVSDELAAYQDNPEHQRAKLLTLTSTGRQRLRTISAAQKAWADVLGAEIGAADLRAASAMIERVQQATARSRA